MTNPSRTRDAHHRATEWFGGMSPAIPLVFGVLAVVVAAVAAQSTGTTFLAVTALLVIFTVGVVIYTSNTTTRPRGRGFAAVAAGLAAMLIIGWSGISLTGFNNSWSTGSLFVAVCVFSAIFGFTNRTR